MEGRRGLGEVEKEGNGGEERIRGSGEEGK